MKISIAKLQLRQWRFYCDLAVSATTCRILAKISICSGIAVLLNVGLIMKLIMKARKPRASPSGFHTLRLVNIEELKIMFPLLGELDRK